MICNIASHSINPSKYLMYYGIFKEYIPANNIYQYCRIICNPGGALVDDISVVKLFVDIQQVGHIFWYRTRSQCGVTSLGAKEPTSELNLLWTTNNKISQNRTTPAHCTAMKTNKGPTSYSLVKPYH